MFTRAGLSCSLISLHVAFYDSCCADDSINSLTNLLLPQLVVSRLKLHTSFACYCILCIW